MNNMNARHPQILRSLLTHSIENRLGHFNDKLAVVFHKNGRRYGGVGETNYPVAIAGRLWETSMLMSEPRRTTDRLRTKFVNALKEHIRSGRTAARADHYARQFADPAVLRAIDFSAGSNVSIKPPPYAGVFNPLAQHERAVEMTKQRVAMARQLTGGRPVTPVRTRAVAAEAAVVGTPRY
jgi:hypothetical protein